MKRGAVCSEKEKMKYGYENVSMFGFLLRYCTRVTFYYSRKREKREEKTTQSSLFLRGFGSQREYTCKESRVALEGGFALVTVLLLASLLMVMLVGLFFLTGEEEKRSSLYIEGERTTMLVETALAEVKAKLMDGGEVPYRDGVARASMTACPGLLEVRRYDVLPNRGYQLGRKAFTDENSFFRKPFARKYEREEEGDWQSANPRWIALYSQKWYAPLCQYMSVEEGEVRDRNPDYNPERVFNLNTADNPFRPGRLYFGGMGGKSRGVKNISLRGNFVEKGKENFYQYRAGENNVERPLYVQWIPLYQDPRYGAVLPNGQSNPLVGRYAYWVDVENTKININSVRRDWEQTALGELTGKSDAGRGKRKGAYFEQWGETEKDTPRYAMEYYKPSTYKLFRDKLATDYGVRLYYRPNYGELSRKRGKGYAIEEYEKRIFGWEKGGLPPAIADHTTIDWGTFAALRPDWGKTRWLEKLLKRGLSGRGYTHVGELLGMLDPEMEKKKIQRGRVGLKGFEKMYGQGLTLYGWEEERDPLGRPKLDINAILREGDALFDEGEGLPEPDHSGTPLQQFLARLKDPRYHAAYYPGAYPSGGKEKSFVDGLKAFAGRGADEEAYGEAMLEQLVTNIIEYGRPHEDPPFIDKERGIIGAKSMPHVAEVAIRARSAFWDLWDNSLYPYKAEPEYSTMVTITQPAFPGLEASEVRYGNDFNATQRLAAERLALAQRIAIYFLQGELGDIADPSLSITSGDELLLNILRGGYLNEIPPYLPFPPSSSYLLRELLTHVVVDVNLALVNENPFAKEEAVDWEIELDYSWFDPKQGEWPIEIYGDRLLVDTNPAFTLMNEVRSGISADGNKVRTVKATTRDKYYSPYLRPGKGEKVDQLGYFYGVHDEESNVQHGLYMRAKPKRLIDKNFDLTSPLVGFPKEIFDSSLLPGDLLDGFSNNLGGEYRGVGQPFRLRGWRIYRKGKRYPGARALYHQVPLRHPGQKSKPREFWQMTVDRDGGGPEPPPNCGVLASTASSTFGLLEKKFRYPDFYSLEHFRYPGKNPPQNLGEVPSHEGSIAVPFGLGSERDAVWEDLRQRKEIAASWFSSQTIAEFSNYCESLMTTIPPVRGKKPILVTENTQNSREYPFYFTAPNDPAYFYHVEQELVKEGRPPFRGLEGKLYLPARAIEVYNAWLEPPSGSGISIQRRALLNRFKVRSDIIRFILLQMKLRDEGLHNEEVVRATGRKQESTGREKDDDFVGGMALVERLVCIDPVLGHRTGNVDLRIKREGETYSGHFYGMNGHPWRRYNYYFHHYDKDRNSPQAEVLGSQRRPEPDQCLTRYFSDPRRTDGKSEPEYTKRSRDITWGESIEEGTTIPAQEKTYTFDYAEFKRREIPLDGLTGSVLWNAVLTKSEELPNLRGEAGWSQVSDVEEDDLNVWPYGPGMDVSYGYGGLEGVGSGSRSDRMSFRNGSFLAHAPRGELMTSIGEIGMCHSGFLQRAIDLDRPPLFSGEGVKRLGAPQYGPPMSMLLDLVVPSNFRDGRGRYLSKKEWEKGNYRPYSPHHPRIGTWNVNGKIAHDQYLAIREGGHGELSHESEDFFASGLHAVSLHPAWVPSAVSKRRGNREGIDGENVLDPYLGPFAHYRRGWEHWLGAIGGDYSRHRNLGRGVWNKKKGQDGSREESVYAIARGVNSFSWYPHGAEMSKGGKVEPYVSFGGREGRGNLLVLGRDIGKKGLAGHVSGDGPVYRGGKGAYPLRKGDTVSLYDVTRYGAFPLVHHVSEIGYTGIGKIYTALNHKDGTTPAHGGFEFEEKLVEEKRGGDGILGAMSQAGFARNAPWVMTANQASTSANVFTVHLVTQSLRDDAGLPYRNRAEVEVMSKYPTSKSGFPNSQSPISGLGYMDEEDEVLGEQWARVVIARIPRKDRRGKIRTDRHGAPQYDYRIVNQQVLENRR